MDNKILSAHLDAVMREISERRSSDISPLNRTYLAHYGYIKLQLGKGWVLTNLGKEYLNNNPEPLTTIIQENILSH